MEVGHPKRSLWDGPRLRIGANEEALMSHKTVVELDLVGYSDVCRALEENIGVEIVARFNEQIQRFVDIGLGAIGTERSGAVLATTGDGAILAFDNPTDAHRFAAAVHEATRRHNSERTLSSSRRWFRIGVATGDLYQRPRIGGGQEIAGTVIAIAVRLEAAAKPGEVLVDAVSFASLPAELQVRYGTEETIPGKRGEQFAARRCTIVPYATEHESSPTVQSVLDLFDRLNPRDQLDRLMLVIGMPQQHRPPDTLEMFRRQDKIVDWAIGAGEAGLTKLNAALISLINKQQPIALHADRLEHPKATTEFDGPQDEDAEVECDKDVQQTLDAADTLASTDLVAARNLLLERASDANHLVVSKLEDVRLRLRIARAYKLPTGERAETLVELADAVISNPEIGCLIVEDPVFLDWLSDVVERTDLAASLRTRRSTRWEALLEMIEGAELPQRFRNDVVKLREQDARDILGGREALLRVLSKNPECKTARQRLAVGVPLPDEQGHWRSIEYKDHLGLRYVKIPPGRAKVGAGGPTDDKGSAHWVEYNDGFWISQTPVTVGAFALWKRTAAQSRGQHQWPVVDIYWETASDYCKAVGGRLPTEDEWEYAARGGFNGFVYPWGDEISPAHALFDLRNMTLPWRGLMKKFPPNRFGLFDMVGGLWEWCIDGSPGRRVVKGGSWRCTAEQLHLSFQQTRNTELVGTPLEDTGFRCVLL